MVPDIIVKNWNICYANAVLHICARVYTGWQFSHRETKQQENSQIFCEFLSSMTSGRSFASAKPLLSKIQLKYAQFVIGRQLDAYEFLSAIFDWVNHEDFFKVTRLYELSHVQCAT